MSAQGATFPPRWKCCGLLLRGSHWRGRARRQPRVLSGAALSRARVIVPRGVAGAERMFVRHGDGRRERFVWEAWRRRSSWSTWLAGCRCHDSSCAPIRTASRHFSEGPPRADRDGGLARSATGESQAGDSDLRSDGSHDRLCQARILGAHRELRRHRGRCPGPARGDHHDQTSWLPGSVHHGTWKRRVHPRPAGVAVGSAAPDTGRPPVEVMVEIAALDGIESVELAGASLPGQRGATRRQRLAGHRRQRLPSTASDCSVATAGHCRSVAGTVISDPGTWVATRTTSRSGTGSGSPPACPSDWTPRTIAPRCRSTPRRIRRQPGRCSLRDIETVLVASGAPAGDAARVAACYLLTIAARYRHDAGDDPTPRDATPDDLAGSNGGHCRCTSRR